MATSTGDVHTDRTPGPCNAEMVRSIGADAVIDYTKADFVSGSARFDLVRWLLRLAKVSLMSLFARQKLKTPWPM
jgi:hypothetical protein